jgi:ribosomal 50S subunit-associated protein YjgA (DUF615 family)
MELKLKRKKSEPSLVAQLSKPLRDFVDDITANGADALRAVRERDPAKYLELSTKLLPLIVALNPQAAHEFSDCQSMADIGARLLRNVGVDEEAVTEDMIDRALEANNEFISRLEQIRDRALSNGNGQGELGELN